MTNKYNYEMTANLANLQALVDDGDMDGARAMAEETLESIPEDLEDDRTATAREVRNILAGG